MGRRAIVQISGANAGMPNQVPRLGLSSPSEALPTEGGERSAAWFGGGGRSMASRRAEEVLLDERGVLVSTARFVVDDHTYAIGQITSTRFVTIPGIPHEWRHWCQAGYASLILGPPLSVLGVFLMSEEGMIGAIGVCIGLLLITIGPLLIFWGRRLSKFGLMRRPTEYVVTISTSGGDVQVLHNSDEVFARRVAKAVAEALVIRAASRN